MHAMISDFDRGLRADNGLQIMATREGRDNLAITTDVPYSRYEYLYMCLAHKRA